MSALAELDTSFFRVRFDRLAPAEKRYLRVMVALGVGLHRSGDIAEQLGVKVSSVGPTRNSLIAKGDALQPRPKRYRLNRAAFRPINGAGDAGGDGVA